jgi:uncharacterized protein YeaO (DUF488 family)
MDHPQIPRMSILLDRVYSHHAKIPKGNTMTILVDRLWPRGIRKEDLPLDYWAKEWAPSPELRKKFHEGTFDFRSFKAAYREEIERKSDEIADFLQKRHPSTVLLLYGLKDPTENNASVLKEVLEEWMH